jgi:crossover junction endodeoxyribonuclease RusA
MIRITMPLPWPELSPNARVHWAAKHTATAEYRERARIAACIAVPASQRPRWREARICFAAYFKTARRRDPDNLIASTKSLLDGLRDAGILADDDRLVLMPPTMGVDPVRPRLEITIEALCAEEVDHAD